MFPFRIKFFWGQPAGLFLSERCYLSLPFFSTYVLLSTGHWLLPSCQLSRLYPKLYDVWSSTNKSLNASSYTNKPLLQITLKLLASITWKNWNWILNIQKLIEWNTIPDELIKTWFLKFLLTAIGPLIDDFFEINRYSSLLAILMFLADNLSYKGVQKQGKCDCLCWNLARIHPKTAVPTALKQMLCKHI